MFATHKLSFYTSNNVKIKSINYDRMQKVIISKCVYLMNTFNESHTKPHSLVLCHSVTGFNHWSRGCCINSIFLQSHVI